MEDVTESNPLAYLTSWSQELEARAQRVRALIGDAHWLSDGNHKEALLREFLRRYLPPELVITNGFVRSPSAENNCSPEVDILIVNPSAHPPFFAEGELQIVPPTSVVAHIEVKTTFTADNLKNALSNICRTQTVVGRFADASRIWRCICFYAIPESRTTETIIETISHAIKHLIEEQGQFSSDATLLSHLPTCIVTVSGYLGFFSLNDDEQLRIRLFELGDLSLSCALADLFSSLRCRNGGTVIGELDDLIEALDIPEPRIHTIII